MLGFSLYEWLFYLGYLINVGFIMLKIGSSLVFNVLVYGIRLEGWYIFVFN